MIDQMITMQEAIEVSALAYREFSSKMVQVPQRVGIKLSRGTTFFMPGYLQKSGSLAVKVVSVFNNNSSKNIPVVNGVMLLINSETGQPLAIMDGTRLTAIRTGAASGIATDLLARKEASKFALLGAGGQAFEQVRAIMSVRKIKNLSIFSQTNNSAYILAKLLQNEYPQLKILVARTSAEAVKGADIITCVTNSNTPVFDPVNVSPGVHINGIGSFLPEMREVQLVGLPNLRIFVDSLQAILAEGGDIIQAIREGYVTTSECTEIGTLLSNGVPGRINDDDITFFKSVGLAVQDTALAFKILQNAIKKNMVSEIEI
jgi:ornithine cyclodeaminase